MGVWSKKSGRKLRDVVVTLKRDQKWAAEFIRQACGKNRAAADLFRQAFAKHFADGRDADVITDVGPVEKQNWERIPIRIPERMSWMSEAIETKSGELDLAPSDVLFIAFCEVHGDKFPRLRTLYQNWRELNLGAA